MAGKQFGTSIDKKTIDNIIKQINEVEINKLDSILNEDIIKLKKSAIKFLQIVLNTQEKIRSIELMMQAQKKRRDQIRTALGVTGRFLSEYETAEYRKFREELTNELRNQEVEKLYEAAFTFHEEINNCLGQEVQTVILLQDNNGEPFLFNVSKDQIFNNKILNYEETSKTAKLTARFKVSINQMRQAGIEALNRDDLNINDNLNISNLNIAYKSILYRYDTYKRLVLWLFPNNVWNKSRVSARGDIAEAYSMFFLKKAEYDFQSSNKEENINYFMVLGVQNVDNVSGLLQGDVSDGKYEYAIKSADASYMSIQQMIPLAQKIVNNDKYTLVDLQKYKEALAKKKAKIRNPIEKYLENSVNESIQEIINTIDLTK